MIHQDTAALWLELAALCIALEATEPTEGATDDN